MDLTRESSGNTLQYSCLENPLDREAIHGTPLHPHPWGNERGWEDFISAADPTSEFRVHVEDPQQESRGVLQDNQL